MGGQTASWFLLIGLITFIFSNAKSFDEELFLVVENKQKKESEQNSIKRAKIIAWICIAINLIVVFQGFHLLQSGYSFEIDPELAGRASTRARGKGGIIILLLKYFPYFLIGGYGYFVYESFRKVLKYLPDRLKKLDKASIKFQSMTSKEKEEALKDIFKRKEAIAQKEKANKDALDLLEKTRKEALRVEPKFLTNKNEEGWIVDPNFEWYKRFYLEVNPTGKTFIIEQTGKPFSNKPPIIKKQIRLLQKEAKSDYKYYLNNGWYPCSKKWF